jgi:hypothetical protein
MNGNYKSRKQQRNHHACNGVAKFHSSDACPLRPYPGQIFVTPGMQGNGFFLGATVTSDIFSYGALFGDGQRSQEIAPGSRSGLAEL